MRALNKAPILAVVLLAFCVFVANSRPVEADEVRQAVQYAHASSLANAAVHHERPGHRKGRKVVVVKEKRKPKKTVEEPVTTMTVTQVEESESTEGIEESTTTAMAQEGVTPCGHLGISSEECWALGCVYIEEYQVQCWRIGERWPKYVNTRHGK